MLEFPGSQGNHRPLATVVITLLLGILLAACAPTASSGQTAGQRSSPQTALGSQRAALSPACASAEQDVAIPDPALARAVMNSLRWDDRDATTIPCSQLARITSLMARGVGDLEGLQFAVNLSSLKIEDSDVASLAHLNGLTRLQTVEIVRGSLAGLDSLSDVPALTVLNVSGNSIDDLSAVARFPRLIHLQANDNRLSDISSLSVLRDLYWLELSDNDIADISALASLTSLGVLKLNRNAVTDAGPLAGLTKLGWIELEDNLLTDVDFVTNLELRILKLARNHITSVRGLASNRSLGAEQPYDLRHNCIDLASADPFLQDMLERGTSLLLEPQSECSAG